MMLDFIRSVMMGLVFTFIVLMTIDSAINVHDDIKKWLKGKKK